MSTKYLKFMPYIKCDIDFGVPLLAFLGLIHSFWVIDLFWLSISGEFYNWRRYDKFMANTIKNTHYAFAFSSVYLLYMGFKDLNKKYIRLWYYIKVFESVVAVIAGFIFLIAYLQFWIYYLIATIILGWGYYLINCVRRGFNELISEEDTSSILSEVNQILDDLDLNVKINEDKNGQTKILIGSEVRQMVHNSL